MLHDKPRMERQVTFVLLLGASDADAIWNDALDEVGEERIGFRSACLLRTSMTADEIRDHLSRRAPDAGRIMVVEAGAEAAWTGLNPIDADWLLERL